MLLKLQRLESHDLVDVVHHPSLPSHKDYDTAKRIIPKGTGMIAFTLKGESCCFEIHAWIGDDFFEATSLGGVESLVECPFNSSHMFIPEDVRIAAGLGMVS